MVQKPQQMRLSHSPLSNDQDLVVIAIFDDALESIEKKFGIFFPADKQLFQYCRVNAFGAK
jgi:hypothetical protein